MKTAYHFLLLAAALPSAFLSAHADLPERDPEPAPLPLEVNWRGGESTQADGWYNLTRLNQEVKIFRNGAEQTLDLPGLGGYGIYPGNAAWPSDIAAQLKSNAGSNARIARISKGPNGGPYPASGSLYFGSDAYDEGAYGGTIAVKSNAISDLNTIVFQISIGEEATHDFYQDQLPTLTLTLSDKSTISALSATHSNNGNPIQQAYYDTMKMEVGEGGELEDVDIFINLYALQWDLSGVALSDGITIESFDITIEGVEHAQIYYMQLDQSNGIYHNAILVVPEPATYALLLGAGALGLMVLRRRSK